MTKEQQRRQSDSALEVRDLDLESQIEIAEKPQRGAVTLANGPRQSGDSESKTDATEINDQSLSDGYISGPIVTMLLTNDNFEMLFTDSAEDATEIVVNTDFHALFIKDKTASAYLDQYHKAVSDLWSDDSSGSGAGMSSQENPGSFLPLVKRLRSKSPHTKVLLTVKKEVPVDVGVKARKYIHRLCHRLGLSAHDRELVVMAGEIHGLAKFRHPSQNAGSFKSIADAGIKLLRLLNDQPRIVGMLRSMYCALEKRDSSKLPLEVIGANILTIVDLFCDTLQFELDLTRDRCQIIGRELGNLTAKLFLKEVAEAFIALLEDELPPIGESEKPNRVLIYSDGPDRIYALETRLKNESFQPIVTDSLESFVATCKRRRPNLIIMRHHSLPRNIIKTLQHLSSKGINVSSIPVYLLVRGIFVDHLAPLLELGIRDIIDLDGNIDVLMVKLRKTRMELEADPRKTPDSTQPQAGSRGNLSDMNLIELIQALGPSLRTTRITVKPEDGTADSLLTYLNKGQIIFAQLGNLTGEAAIHRALGWTSGTWIIEPVAEADLPQPNNNLPSESILLEGCRLLDESSRNIPTI